MRGARVAWQGLLREGVILTDFPIALCRITDEQSMQRIPSDALMNPAAKNERDKAVSATTTRRVVGVRFIAAAILPRIGGMREW